MKEKALILLVEDEADLRVLVRDYLLRNGFHVVCAQNAEEALSQMNKKKFDLFLLDIMLPREDGYDIAREIRQTNNSVPIIFTTALAHVDNKLKAFDLRADDYLTKPFELRELKARIEALLRRFHLSLGSNQELVFHGLKLDTQINLLRYKEESLTLKARESEVLHLLMSHHAKIVPKALLLETIWGNHSANSAANLDVQIHSLRKLLEKLAPFEVKTYRAVGYALVKLED